jgi:hypothetical protein
MLAFYTVTKKKPYLRLANKNKRLRWAKEHRQTDTKMYFPTN